MSDEPINLAEARAVKAQDSKLWTPADALRSVLRDIESGKIKPDSIAMWYTVPSEDGGQMMHYCVSGLDRRDHVYLLNHALRRVLNDGANPAL